MATIEDLQYIRSLAAKKYEYEGQEAQLWQGIQCVFPVKEPKDTEKLSLGLPIYLLIFLFVDNRLGALAVDVINSYTWSTYRQMLFPSGVTLMGISFPTLVGIPFGLLVTLLIFLVMVCINAAIKRNNKKMRPQRLEDYKQLELQNEQINQQNQELRNQIAEIRGKREQLFQTIRQNAPWYPEEYFFVTALDYIIPLLQTGKADTLEQAIVRYEVSRQSFAS